MRRVLSSILFCCVAVSLSGCIGFKGNELTKVTDKDVNFTSTNKTRVFSRWKVEGEKGSMYTADLFKPMLISEAAARKKFMDDFFVLSNCCTIVEDPTEADVEVTGTFYYVPPTNYATGISAGTLYVIPTWRTLETRISVDVKKNMNLKSYDIKDHMTLVNWLPLIVGFPFANPNTAENETILNVFLTLLSNMKKDNILN